MFEVKYTQKFNRQFKKATKVTQLAVIEKVDIIKNNPFDQRLNTHKLRGSLRKYWSFSITYEIGVIFTFDGKKLIILQTIGNHDIYKNI